MRCSMTLQHPTKFQWSAERSRGRIARKHCDVKVAALDCATFPPNQTSNASMLSPSALAPYSHYTLPEAVIPELPGCYRGKVRENYDLNDGTRIIIATDRISAFDRNLAVI